MPVVCATFRHCLRSGALTSICFEGGTNACMSRCVRPVPGKGQHARRLASVDGFLSYPPPQSGMRIDLPIEEACLAVDRQRTAVATNPMYALPVAIVKRVLDKRPERCSITTYEDVPRHVVVPYPALGLGRIVWRRAEHEFLGR